MAYHNIKKKLDIVYLLVAIPFMVFSCNKTEYNEREEGEYYECLIDIYTRMDSLEVNFWTELNALYPRAKSPDDPWYTNYIYEGSNEWKALNKKYDDTHYNGYRVLPGQYNCYSNVFTGIEVVSDCEFNGIPAGDDLGSKVRIVARSPYKWLLSKATLSYDWSDIPEDYYIVDANSCKYNGFKWCEFPVNKQLSDLTQDDFVLLETERFYLLFTETPSVKEQNITVTFREGDKSYSATVAATFE